LWQSKGGRQLVSSQQEKAGKTAEFGKKFDPPLRPFCGTKPATLASYFG
jgi:hypothetical protein